MIKSNHQKKKKKETACSESVGLHGAVSRTPRRGGKRKKEEPLWIDRGCAYQDIRRNRRRRRREGRRRPPAGHPSASWAEEAGLVRTVYAEWNEKGLVRAHYFFHLGPITGGQNFLYPPQQYTQVATLTTQGL